MNIEPKSIEQQIECLAKLTGAPESFIGQVKNLFHRKGIDLAEDAAPYIQALEEAFRREHTIRTSSQRSRLEPNSPKHFDKIGKAYVRRAEKLPRLDGSVASSRRKGAGKASRSVTIEGDHRTYVTPTQQDEVTMVPGPDDVQ